MDVKNEINMKKRGIKQTNNEKKKQNKKKTIHKKYVRVSK